MKFEDIKAGDTVYVQEDVNYGRGKVKRFWVPRLVDYEKDEIFIVAYERYRKHNGLQENNQAREAVKLGEETMHNKTVFCQEKEMKAFCLNIIIGNEIPNILSRIGLGYWRNQGHKNLNKIHERLEEVEILIADDGE